MSEQMTFEFKSIKPIKGYPELHWTGKRPYKSTQYFPAQLKEQYGEAKDGWMNKIFWGDNLQVMSHLLKDYRGMIDLIYIDPPFDSKAEYKKTIKLKQKKAESSQHIFEEKQYSDIWVNDGYLQFMYERLVLIREMLSDKGNVFVHCDWHKSHYIRLIMDQVLGKDNFKSEIIWKRTSGHNLTDKSIEVMTDTILFYSKTNDNIFNPIYEEVSEEELDNKFPYLESETGRRYNHEKLEKSSNAYSAGETRIICGKEIRSNIGWIWTQETFDTRLKQNPYLIYWTATGRPRYKNYADEYKGKKLGNLWDDIQPLSSTSNERIDYPTQKPEKLIERIINCASNSGSIVFDCFMGSGTTQAVAMKLGRKFIGADINLGAIQTTTKRLINISKDIVNKEDIYTGFQVYNVNNYDFFRNPVEAKDLLIEALEIEKIDSGNVYDGEKDGRMVKIMPVNRIATKADLEELKANLPYKTFEKRKEENPNDPVERLLLICMGHEPDLKVSLEQELSNYKLDIEIVDILRDKSILELKRESEVEVVRENNKLIIKNFYPMNLLQKMSIMKEYVEDWKVLVESIMIDWNFDGVVMQPSIMDVPGKNELVIGEYDIPEDAGKIKIKITDVLSESLEWEV